MTFYMVANFHSRWNALMTFTLTNWWFTVLTMFWFLYRQTSFDWISMRIEYILQTTSNHFMCNHTHTHTHKIGFSIRLDKNNYLRGPLFPCQKLAIHFINYGRRISDYIWNASTIVIRATHHQIKQIQLSFSLFSLSVRTNVVFVFEFATINYISGYSI